MIYEVIIMIKGIDEDDFKEFLSKKLFLSQKTIQNIVYNIRSLEKKSDNIFDKENVFNMINSYSRNTKSRYRYSYNRFIEYIER